MFPFTITFNKALQLDSDSNVVLSSIEEVLVKLKVDHIEVSNSRINFKNSFFNKQYTNHLMAGINKGYFLIKKDSQVIKYSFSVSRMFYITVCMSAFLGLISKLFLVGCIAFIGLFGMNWILTFIRHKLFLNKLIKKLSNNN